jgi:hypothetical protein
MTVSTYIPDANVETSCVDGSAERFITSETFSTIRAGAGTTGLAHDIVFRIRINSHDSTTNRWQGMERAIITLDTDDLGGQLVSSATFGIVIVDATDTYTDHLVLVDSTPDSNTDITASDYSNLGSTRQADDLAVGDLTVDSDTYNNFTLNSTGLASINTTGITRLGIRSKYDFGGSQPSWAQGKTQVTVVSADSSIADREPLLTVTHSSAFTPKAIMF